MIWLTSTYSVSVQILHSSMRKINKPPIHHSSHSGTAMWLPSIAPPHCGTFQQLLKKVIISTNFSTSVTVMWAGSSTMTAFQNPWTQLNVGQAYPRKWLMYSQYSLLVASFQIAIATKRHSCLAMTWLQMYSNDPQDTRKFCLNCLELKSGTIVSHQWWDRAQVTGDLRLVISCKTTCKDRNRCIICLLDLLSCKLCDPYQHSQC